MTDLTADEMYDRILRSLKENSAEFVRQERAEKTARLRKALVFCLVFAAGVAVGALLVTALYAAG
jgi:hypothetical protein